MYDIPCSVKDCLIMIELKMSLVEVFLGESYKMYLKNIDNKFFNPKIKNNFSYF